MQGLDSLFVTFTFVTSRSDMLLTLPLRTSQTLAHTSQLSPTSHRVSDSHNCDMYITTPTAEMYMSYLSATNLPRLQGLHNVQRAKCRGGAAISALPWGLAGGGAAISALPRGVIVGMLQPAPSRG